MGFTSVFNYPNNDKPEFKVSLLQHGYQFRFFNEDGTEDTESMLSISSDELKPDYKATGYEGKQGMAIQIFRQKFLI